jgi:uncharacterized RDD family membrane protein YckC
MYCPACGASVNNDATECSACRAALIPLPQYQSIVSSDVFTQGYRIARMGDRLLAQLFDAVIVMLLFSIIGMTVAVDAGGLTKNGFSLSGGPAWLALSGTLIAALVYFVLTEGWGGRTLGKALVGIQVRRVDGTSSTLKAALLRNLVRLIDIIPLYLIGFLAALLSKYRQRLGDLAAGTLVVDNRLKKMWQLVLVALWLALIAGGIWASRSIYSLAAGSTPAPAANTSNTSAVPPAATNKEFSAANFKLVESKGGAQRPDGPYKPGDTVFTEYAVSGFTIPPDRGIEVLLDIQVTDPNGAALTKPWHDKVSGTLAQGSEDVNGYYNFELPAFSPAGLYQIVLKATDTRGNNAGVKQSLSFKVEAPNIEPAGALEIRDYESGVRKDALAGGKMVIEAPAKLQFVFKLFGLSFLDDKCDAKLDLKLLGPDGTGLMDRPEWVKIGDEFSYHPGSFYLPITGYFDLPADSAKGTYTQQYKITDNLSGKMLEYAVEFEVR